MGEAERQFSIQSGAIGSGRARMGSAWGVGNALAVFSSPKDSSSAVASGIAPSLHHVTFETRFFWHFEIEILNFGQKELVKGTPNLWFFQLVLASHEEIGQRVIVSFPLFAKIGQGPSARRFGNVINSWTIDKRFKTVSICDTVRPS